VFQPSPYSQRFTAHPAFDHPVAGEWGDGADVAKGISGTIGAGATGVKAGALLAGAGASATVPVAGWIVGGALAAAAGTVAIVQGVKKRKVNKKQALAWAKSLGLPMRDARDVAGFVIRLSKKDAKWRKRQKARIKRRLARIARNEKRWKRRPGLQRTGQIAAWVFTGALARLYARGPKQLAKDRRKNEAKLALITALEKSIRRRRSPAEETLSTLAIPPSTAPVESSGLTTVYGGLPLWGWLALGTAALGTFYVATRKR
jgi:hypothetical protein